MKESLSCGKKRRGNKQIGTICCVDHFASGCVEAPVGFQVDSGVPVFVLCFFVSRRRVATLAQATMTPLAATFLRETTLNFHNVEANPSN